MTIAVCEEDSFESSALGVGVVTMGNDTGVLMGVVVEVFVDVEVKISFVDVVMDLVVDGICLERLRRSG